MSFFLVEKLSITFQKFCKCLKNGNDRLQKGNPLRRFAQLSVRKIARTTVLTERGNLGCDSHNVCRHAPSHENGSKHLRHRFWWHIGILPLHTEEEKEKEIQGYICTPFYNTDFFILSLQLDNELPMSEMSKNREVTDFAFAIKRMKSYLNFEKLVLVTPHGLSGC